MRRLIAVLLVVLTSMVIGHTPTLAATSSILMGGGWTLTLSSPQASRGEVLTGTFRSLHHTYRVAGDLIPAADVGNDLLRFYGRPFFAAQGTVGLVGVAMLGNTCTPSFAGSTRYRLQEVPNLSTLPNTLPGVGLPGLYLQLKVH